MATVTSSLNMTKTKPNTNNGVTTVDCTAQLTAECVTTVFSAGFFLTVTCWGLGITLGVALGVIRKL